MVVVWPRPLPSAPKGIKHGDPICVYTRGAGARVASNRRSARLPSGIRTCIFRTMNNTARVLKNAVSDEVVAMERRPGGCRFEDVRHLGGGSSRGAIRGTRGSEWEV